MESRQEVLDKGFVEMLSHMGSDNTIVAAARVSLLGESKGEKSDKNLINYLLQNKHTTPFEHVVFTFRVKCPLFVARQWMRHRTWSYNEVSRRYTDEDIDFYIPTVLRKQAENNRQASLNNEVDHIVDGYCDADPIDYSGWKVKEFMQYHTYYCVDAYNILLSNGVAREQARMVLPQNLYTMFYATVDLHNLFHFLELRDSEHAQYEIRVYAQAIEELIKPVVPWSYEAWEKEYKNG